MRPGWTEGNHRTTSRTLLGVLRLRTYQNRSGFSAMLNDSWCGDGLPTLDDAQLAAESHARRVLAEALVELGYGWDDGTDDESGEQGDAGDPGNPDDDPIAAALRDKIAEMARGTDMIECEIAAKEAEVRRLRGLMGQEGPAARRPEDDPQ